MSEKNGCESVCEMGALQRNGEIQQADVASKLIRGLLFFLACSHVDSTCINSLAS